MGSEPAAPEGNEVTDQSIAGARREPIGSDKQRRWPRALTITAIGGILGIIVALITVFGFVEERVSDPAAPVLGSQIESAGLEPTRQTLGDYLVEQKLSTRGLTREELDEEGLIFLARIRLQGSLGEKMYLRWRLYTSEGKPVRGEPYDQLLGEYTPENQNHFRRAAFWLPYPPRPGTYFARFTLLDDDRTPIDDLSTKPFQIRRIPP